MGHPEITRTIKSTKAHVLFVNLQTTTTFTKEVNLAGVYKNNDAMLKAVVKYNPDIEKPVMILDSEVQEQLYGMSLNDFIANSKVYPPRQTTAKKAENIVEIS